MDYYYYDDDKNDYGSTEAPNADEIPSSKPIQIVTTEVPIQKPTDQVTTEIPIPKPIQIVTTEVLIQNLTTPIIEINERVDLQEGAPLSKTILNVIIYVSVSILAIVICFCICKWKCRGYGGTPTGFENPFYSGPPC